MEELIATYFIKGQQYYVYGYYLNTKNVNYVVFNKNRKQFLTSNIFPTWDKVKLVIGKLNKKNNKNVSCCCFTQ